MKKNLIILFTFFILSNIYAQLTVDPTFNLTEINLNGPNGTILAMVLQPDGKIIIGGNFQYTNNGVGCRGIARLNNDGTLDSNFNPGSGINGSGSVGSLALQSDGRILIGGKFDNYNGFFSKHLVRIMSDGSYDSSFNTGTGFTHIYPNQAVGAIKIQSDGKIIAGGSFKYVNNIERNNIARLNSDGNVDISFNPGTGTSGNSVIAAVSAIDTDSSNRIYIGGDFNSYNNIPRGNIIRVLQNGSFDSTFNPGPGIGTDFIVNKILCLSTNHILIGGGFTQYNTQTVFKIVKITESGSIAPNFISPLISANIVYNIAQYSNNKYLIAGSLYPNGVMAAIDENGIIDQEMSCPIEVSSGTPYAIAVQPDGKIIVAGNCGYFDSVNSVGYYSIIRFESPQLNIEENVIYPKNWCIPNPVADILSLGIAGEIKNVRIMDLVGKEVYRSNSKNKLIDVSFLKKGLYIIEIVEIDTIKTNKFVKI